MIKVEEGNLKEVKNARKKYPHEDLNAKNKLGQTALHIATRNGDYSIVGYLLKQGADINTKNRAGQTSLFSACWYGKLNIAQLLIKNHADLNISDNRGWTPLMAACHHSNFEMINYLLKCGADVRPFDCFGKKASDRVTDSILLKILDELEIKQEQKDFIEKEEDKRLKKCLSRSRGRSTKRKSNEFARVQDSHYLSKEKSSRKVKSPNSLKETSPLRSCPGFVHDMKIYKMHDKVGYYNYFRKKHKIKKSESIEYSSETDIDSSLHSIRKYSLARNDKMSRTPPRSLPKMKKRRISDYSNEGTQIKLERTLKSRKPTRMSKLEGNTNHNDQFCEHFAHSMRSLNKLKEEIQSLSKTTLQTSLGSIESPHRYNDSQSNIFSSPGSFPWLSSRENVPEKNFNLEQRDFFSMFFEKLPNKLSRTLDSQVNHIFADPNFKNFTSASKDVLKNFILQYGSDIVKNAVYNLKDLANETFKSSETKKCFLTSLGRQNEMFSKTGLDAANEKMEEKQIGLGRKTKNNFPLESSLTGYLQEEEWLNPEEDGNMLKNIKQDAVDYLKEIFITLDECLSKAGEERLRIYTLSHQEIVKSFTELNQKLKEIGQDEVSDLDLEFNDFQNRLTHLSQSLQEKEKEKLSSNHLGSSSKSSRMKSSSKRFFDFNQASNGSFNKYDQNSGFSGESLPKEQYLSFDKENNLGVQLKEEAFNSMKYEQNKMKGTIETLQKEKNYFQKREKLKVENPRTFKDQNSYYFQTEHKDGSFDEPENNLEKFSIEKISDEFQERFKNTSSLPGKQEVFAPKFFKELNTDQNIKPFQSQTQNKELYLSAEVVRTESSVKADGQNILQRIQQNNSPLITMNFPALGSLEEKSNDPTLGNNILNQNISASQLIKGKNETSLVEELNEVKRDELMTCDNSNKSNNYVSLKNCGFSEKSIAKMKSLIPSKVQNPTKSYERSGAHGIEINKKPFVNKKQEAFNLKYPLQAEDQNEKQNALVLGTLSKNMNTHLETQNGKEKRMFETNTHLENKEEGDVAEIMRENIQKDTNNNQKAKIEEFEVSMEAISTENDKQKAIEDNLLQEQNSKNLNEIAHTYKVQSKNEKVNEVKGSKSINDKENNSQFIKEIPKIDSDDLENANESRQYESSVSNNQNYRNVSNNKIPNDAFQCEYTSQMQRGDLPINRIETEYNENDQKRLIILQIGNDTLISSAELDFQKSESACQSLNKTKSILEPIESGTTGLYSEEKKEKNEKRLDYQISKLPIQITQNNSHTKIQNQQNEISHISKQSHRLEKERNDQQKIAKLRGEAKANQDPILHPQSTNNVFLEEKNKTNSLCQSSNENNSQKNRNLESTETQSYPKILSQLKIKENEEPLVENNIAQNNLLRDNGKNREEGIETNFMPNNLKNKKNSESEKNYHYKTCLQRNDENEKICDPNSMSKDANLKKYSCNESSLNTKETKEKKNQENLEKFPPNLKKNLLCEIDVFEQNLTKEIISKDSQAEKDSDRKNCLVEENIANKSYSGGLKQLGSRIMEENKENNNIAEGDTGKTNLKDFSSKDNEFQEKMKMNRKENLFTENSMQSKIGENKVTELEQKDFQMQKTNEDEIILLEGNNSKTLRKQLQVQNKNVLTIENNPKDFECITTRRKASEFSFNESQDRIGRASPVNESTSSDQEIGFDDIFKQYELMDMKNSIQDKNIKVDNFHNDAEQGLSPTLYGLQEESPSFKQVNILNLKEKHKFSIEKQKKNSSQNSGVHDVKNAPHLEGRTNLHKSSMTRNMRSFSEKVGHLIPLPSPSRYLKKILKMRIEEVPFCEDFHYPGQLNKKRSLSSMQKKLHSELNQN